MVRAIERIHNLPVIPKKRQDKVRHFLQKLEQTLNFAPDRHQGHLFCLNSADNTFIGETAKLEASLEHDFFEKLYIERSVYSDIEGYLPSQRLILFHGLMGTGKTAVLMKLARDINQKGLLKFEYFDFKALVEDFSISNVDNFETTIHAILYNEIKKKYIDIKENIIKEWLIYKIQNDIGYLKIKELILDNVQHPLNNIEWLKIVKQPAIKKMLTLSDSKPNLVTLLRFVQKDTPVILCLDNVDRFALKEQRLVLEACIHISNEAELPIILSIRTPHLRRITGTGAKGDFVYFKELDRLNPLFINISKMDTPDDRIRFDIPVMGESIHNLLEKRVEFINQHGVFNDLGEYFTSTIEQNNISLDIKECSKQFIDIFKTISSTFIDEDVYNFCNHSIRSILIFYFNFISKLTLNSEPEYSIGSLLSYKKEVRKTKLRNFLYKWLICGDEVIPDCVNAKVPNFYEKVDGVPMIGHKVLSYLYNHKGMTEGVSIPDMVQDFWRLGIERATLRKILLDFTADQENNENGLIWLDAIDDTILDDARVFLMPAGEYFLKNLSLSREYAFWMALISDLPIADVSKLIGKDIVYFNETYSDKFKLEVIFNLITMILLPGLNKEIIQYQTRLYLPSWWTETNIMYYLRTFTIDGHFYLNRLLNSILNSIQFSYINDTDKEMYKQKYLSILRNVEKIEDEVTR